MSNYTVLLLRPDYIADVFGHDTYLAHVVANGVELAMAAGQEEAAFADVEEGCEVTPDDYHVLFTTIGHHEDLSVGSTYEGETR